MRSICPAGAKNAATKLCPHEGSVATASSISRKGSVKKDPAKKYAPPHGRLFLAYLDDEAVGVIALRMIDKDKCELKRLYVKKEARGKGIARMLVEKLIAEAKAIGYKTMYLDSLPQLEDAIALYRKIGFSDTERYNRSPCENTIFMKLDLT